MFIFEELESGSSSSKEDIITPEWVLVVQLTNLVDDLTNNKSEISSRLANLFYIGLKSTLFSIYGLSEKDYVVSFLSGESLNEKIFVISIKPSVLADFVKEMIRVNFKPQLANMRTLLAEKIKLYVDGINEGNKFFSLELGPVVESGENNVLYQQNMTLIVKPISENSDDES